MSRRSYYTTLPINCSITPVVAQQMRDYFEGTGICSVSEREGGGELHLSVLVDRNATPEQCSSIEEEWNNRLHNLEFLCNDIQKYSTISVIENSEYLSPLAEYAQSLNAIIAVWNECDALGGVSENEFCLSNTAVIYLGGQAAAFAAEWLCYLLATLEMYRSGDPAWRWSDAAWGRAEELYRSFYSEPVDFSVFREAMELGDFSLNKERVEEW